MDKVIITINRHNGSGGKAIGQMLAKELNIPVYNRDITRMASEESGINETLFNELDERLKKTPLSMRFGANTRAVYTGDLIPPGDPDFVSDKNLFNYQALIIQKLAAAGSCVIVGRAADFVLKGNPYLVSTFVHASHEYCLRQIISRREYSGNDPEHSLEQTDRYRSDFYNYYTGQTWNDARNYDLCLNSEKLGYEGCVEAIRSYIRIRFGE